jgi:regulator of sigma E protease
VAVALNAEPLGITEPGLKPGDVIVSIDGHKPEEFTDVGLAAAMARRDSVLDVEVKRPGVGQSLLFQIQPKESPSSHMLQMGIEPMLSATLVEASNAKDKEILRKALDKAGLKGVEGGMLLVRIGGKDASNYADVGAAFAASNGKPVEAVFTDKDKKRTVTVMLSPRRELPGARFEPVKDVFVATSHLLGLMPVMRVETVNEGGEAAGLGDGDVFVQLGGSEWPSVPAGMAEIKSRKGKSVRVAVWRRDEKGSEHEVDLGEVKVARDGTIGFLLGDTTSLSARIAAWPGALAAPDAVGKGGGEPSGAALGLPSGSVITAVDHRPVRNLTDVLDVLGEEAASGTAEGGMTVQVSYRTPLRAGSESAVEEVAWKIPAGEVEQIRRLSWASPVGPELFTLKQFPLVAKNPVEAVKKGLKDTRRVLQNTYVTFARLFQGSVKVEHLKGPVGIADIGTQLARRGPMWLMFFMALVSVNLAVVNFLPIPIADGGHFVFLLYEQFTGRPVSAAVQNIAALVGLALIGGLFLLVTFNDVSNLIGDWFK